MVRVSPRLLHIRTSFEKAIETKLEFIASLSSLKKTAGGRILAVAKPQQEILGEMAFIALFTAWEQFLEDSFIWLVVEAPLSLFRNRHKVLVTDRNTANDLICGSRKYVEWANPEIVREKAKIFFKNGEPYESILSSIANDLLRMRIIRNRCVHYSQHAMKQYDNMLLKIYGARKRISPGGLLTGVPPRGLSTASNAITYATVFELYGDILMTACAKIIPVRNR